MSLNTTIDRLKATAGTAEESPLVRFASQVARQYSRDDVSGLSAELTYRIFLAIFPFAIFLAALSGFVAAAAGIGDPAGDIVKSLGTLLPADAASLLGGQLRQVMGTRSGALLTFGAIAALWSATGGVNAVIKAMNRVYEVDERRRFVGRYALAIGLTLVAAAGLIVAFALLVPVQILAGDIATAAGIPAVLVTVGGIGVAILLLFAAVLILYRLTPNVTLPWTWHVPGAVLAVMGWLLATAAFGFYVANFGRFNATYGALGAVIVLLLWFYVSSLVLLLGAEINQVRAEHRHDRELSARKRLVAIRQR